MNNSNKLRACIIAVILLICFGCTEPFTIHTNDSPPVPVIYGLLTNKFEHQELMITRSSSYFDNKPNVGISNAEVIVQSSDNKFFKFIEKYDTIPGLYVSENAFAACVGTEYKLSVTMDFNGDSKLDRYEASTTILPSVVVDSIVIEPIDLMGHKSHILYAYFQDPVGDKNYMAVNIFHNDSLLTAKISNVGISSDELIKNQQVKASLFRFDDISEKEKDSPENQKRSIYLQQGDLIEASISLISKGYFDFISQCRKEMGGENPMFGGPASNITTNISNCGVGYFAGYNIQRTSIRFDGK